MATGNFPCMKCDRRFSMPAHLARHMNTIHASRAMKLARKKAGRRGKVGRPKGSRGRAPSPAIARAAGPMSADGGTYVLSIMRDHHANLTAQRTMLDRELAALSSAINTMGGGPALGKRGSPRGRPATRAGREGTLKQYITQVLKQYSTPIGPREIAGAVKKAGYRTKAHDLTKAVSNTLAGLNGVRKVGFGMYRM